MSGDTKYKDGLTGEIILIGVQNLKKKALIYA